MAEERLVVLLHGAGTGAWVWDRVQAAMGSPSLALDVGGREAGATPKSVAERIAEKIDATGACEVTLVMHSLSGVLAPGLALRLGLRLAGCVYVSAVIPPAGSTFVDAMPLPNRLVLRLLFRFSSSGLKPSESMIRRELCNDLDEKDTAMVLERYEAEYPGLYLTPVAGPPPVPSTYVRLLQDNGVVPSSQESMIARLREPEVVVLDAGHLAMLSRPAELATIIETARVRMAARSPVVVGGPVG